MLYSFIPFSHLKRGTSHSQSESHHIRRETIITFQALTLEHYSHRVDKKLKNTYDELFGYVII